MSELKKTVYERVVDVMHGIDDTVRDTIVYPTNHDVVGISEGDDFLVLTYATKLEEDQPVQQVWINASKELEPLQALAEAILRVTARVNERELKKAMKD